MVKFISRIKYQTDSIIEREGRCPYQTGCMACVYFNLCNRKKSINNSLVLSWANKVKANEYNIDIVLFEELL